MVEGASPTPPSPPDLIEGDQKFVSILGQFFLIPLAIAVVGVGIFVGVRMMTGEEKDPVLMVREIRLNHGSTRWQIAYDLNSRLVRDPEARKNPLLIPELLRAFKEINPPRDEDEARTRTYLVTILGTLRDPAALPVLLPAMRDRDGACQVAAIQAVGAIGDPAALPELLDFAASDDAGLRKAAVFSLGLFNPRRRRADNLAVLGREDDERVRLALRTAHRDVVEDVKWNAALALARWEEKEAATTLKLMMDREYLRKYSAAAGNSMNEEMMADVVVNAMKGAVELQDASFRPQLEQIGRSDPSMSVRDAARVCLQALKG